MVLSQASCMRHVCFTRIKHALTLGQMKAFILQSANGHLAVCKWKLLVDSVIIRNSRLPDNHLLLPCIGAPVEKRNFVTLRSNEPPALQKPGLDPISTYFQHHLSSMTKGLLTHPPTTSWLSSIPFPASQQPQCGQAGSCCW